MTLVAGQTLTTERLVLQPFTETHLTERYVGWLNDPEVVRFSEHRHRRYDMQEARRYFANFANSPHYY